MEKYIRIQKINHDLDKEFLASSGHQYLLLYARSATGELTFNYRRFKLQPRRFFLLPAGPQKLAIDWPGTGWLITFDGWLLRAFFELHPEEQLLPLFLQHKKPYADLSPATASAVHILAQLLDQNEQGGATPKIAYSYLDALLLHLSHAYRLENKLLSRKPNYTVAEQLLPLIALHYRAERMPAFYAAQLGIPLRKLNKITKGTMGKLVQELISEQVLTEAERLLAESPLSIKEVAYELDFADMAQFSHFVKKHTGRSPTEFRQQL